MKLFPHVHVLDIHEVRPYASLCCGGQLTPRGTQDGEMKPHVDSVKFSGGVVAGLSLLSPCVFELHHEKSPARVHLLLEPGTFYIMQYSPPFHSPSCALYLDRVRVRVRWQGRRAVRVGARDTEGCSELQGEGHHPHASAIGDAARLQGGRHSPGPSHGHHAQRTTNATTTVLGRENVYIAERRDCVCDH